MSLSGGGAGLGEHFFLTYFISYTAGMIVMLPKDLDWKHWQTEDTPRGRGGFIRLVFASVAQLPLAAFSSASGTLGKGPEGCDRPASEMACTSSPRMFF